MCGMYVESKQILVYTKCTKISFGPNSFVMHCLSLIHAVSQMKCQKSYLLNALVLQELIKDWWQHSRSAKIIIIPTYIEYLYSKSLTNQVAKQTKRTHDLFRWPSNRGSKKPWVRVCMYITMKAIINACIEPAEFAIWSWKNVWFCGSVE
jgi:hypothetical protein